MLGIKYVIKNKLQNNKKHNNNARSTLEKPARKNQPSIIELLLVLGQPGQGCQERLSCSLWHITIEDYNHIYKVLYMQIQLPRNQEPLKPCAWNHLQPCSFSTTYCLAHSQVEVNSNM